MAGQSPITRISSKENECHTAHYHQHHTEKHTHPEGVIGHNQPQKRRDTWGILPKTYIFYYQGWHSRVPSTLPFLEAIFYRRSRKQIITTAMKVHQYRNKGTGGQNSVDSLSVLPKSLQDQTPNSRNSINSETVWLPLFFLLLMTQTLKTEESGHRKNWSLFNIFVAIPQFSKWSGTSWAYFEIILAAGLLLL